VARVAATALETAVADLVLRPFGLTETRYAHPVDGDVVIASSAGDAIERAMIETGEPYPVQGSVTDFSGWRSYPLVGEVNDGNAYHAFGGCAGHAGLFTTAGDLVRFGRGMLDSLAGRGPVTAPTAREFVAPGADPTQGLGFRVWAGPHGPAVGHTGFPGVAFALLPDQEAVAVMITNRLHAAGPPPPTEPMWELVRGAAHSLLRSRA
jgi:CubicO group peptidase (beta-lactamase class C family)